ncbi:MAG TPA: hypothetical protein VJT67_12815 [Longimicrobiaceae bacterium]|nr:hypothetical protein [Longimicrobiaceae bacterium]
MRKPHAIAILAALALAACGDGATAPTDADLLGTWSIVPTPTALPDGKLQRMTVQFGAGGSYALEAATFGARAPSPLAFGTQRGRVSASGGQLHFHPSTAFSVGRRPALRATGAGFELADIDLSQGDVPYEVIGDHLLLHLPALPAAPLVLTRTGP